MNRSRKCIVNNIFSYLLNNYYCFVFFFYLLTTFFLGFHVGWLSFALISCLVLFNGHVYKDGLRIHKSMLLIVVYAIWCLSTGVFSFSTDVPISVYISAVCSSIIAIFFVGFPIDINSFWTKFVVLYDIYGVIGLWLMVLQPIWYLRYCSFYGYSHIRLSTFIGSITMGCFGAISLLITLWMIIESKGKKGKLLYIFTIICTVATMQRSAWIVAAITLVISHYCVFIKWKVFKLEYFFLEIIFAGVSLGIGFKLIINKIMEQYIILLSMRSQNGMFSSRVGQWLNAIEHSNILIGSGYGSRGHGAYYAGIEGTVCDGSWVNLLCEIGIIGTVMFILIIMISLKKGFSDFRNLYLPIGIILIISMQAIGSNVFESQLIMPIFWISVGMIYRFKRP